MQRFSVLATPLEGVSIVERRALGDERGFLTRLFCADELRAAGWTKPVAQINHTLTARRGTVRGMHFQRPPHAEMKLVSCLRGVVFDVVVDLRAGSPTFMSWFGERLSADNRRAMLIPEGCAHGFQTLSDDCELVYVHSAPYVAAAEGAVNATDPKLKIDWPEPITARSERDAAHALIGADFRGIDG
jgi:dTDP-4-dehydrorhamnose 3,5-epimerase